MTNKQQKSSLFFFKPSRKYVRQWLADGKLVGGGDSYTPTPEEFDKRISTQLVLIVNMRKKTIAGRNTSMRRKRKVFSYS